MHKYGSEIREGLCEISTAHFPVTQILYDVFLHVCMYMYMYMYMFIVYTCNVVAMYIVHMNLVVCLHVHVYEKNTWV